MNKNIVLLNDLYDNTFDFKYFLKEKDTIIWKNCENLIINVKSKINKFIFINCKNIKLKMSDAIIGLELENCHNMDIKIRKSKKIYCIELFKSDIKLNKSSKKFFTMSENSKIKYN